MPVATPPSVVVPFASGAGPSYITNPLPVASQIGIANGRASYTDGFPPLTMVDPTLGGVPPFGSDMNGVLYPLSAHVAYTAAGGLPRFNSAVVSEAGGYGVGAVIQSAATPALFFYNTVNNNTNDPDSVATGWVPFSPLSAPTGVQAATLGAGTTNDFAMAAGTGAIDFDPSAGASVVTGITAGFNGQIIVVTNVNASNPLTINALDAGSSAANRIRLPANITLLQYSNLTLRYFTALALWVPV